MRLERDVRFQWCDANQAIANPNVLATADFTRRFIIQTDASSSAAMVTALLRHFSEGRKPKA